MSIEKRNLPNSEQAAEFELSALLEQLPFESRLNLLVNTSIELVINQLQSGDQTILTQILENVLQLFKLRNGGLVLSREIEILLETSADSSLSEWKAVNELNTLLASVGLHIESTHGYCLNVISDDQAAVDIGKVRAAFGEIIGERQDRSRNEPLWFERIWDAFNGNEDNAVTFQQIGAAFNTEKAAKNALSQIRSALQPYDLDISMVKCYFIRVI